MIDGTAIAALPEPVLPAASGCVAFFSTLAASTTLQNVLGISTGTKLVPSVLGFVTVCYASLVSQNAAVSCHGWLRENRRRFTGDGSSLPRPKELVPTSEQMKRLLLPELGDDRDCWRVNGHRIPRHEVRVCALGALTFLALGGRFWGIAPSSYTHIGSFKRWSIPCGKNYATTAQRTMIERMGKLWGCHTCGSRMLFHRGQFSFVGDHMPPKSIAEQANKTWLRRYLLGKVRFRFYPQCTKCSNVQGSALSQAKQQLGQSVPASLRAAQLRRSGAGRSAYNHGLRPRASHLTGGAIAWTTTAGASDRDIQRGNPKRFRAAHELIHDWSLNVASLFQLRSR